MVSHLRDFTLLSAAKRLARRRVLVVGAGFGGLEVARGLKRADVDTVLVDQHNYHLFTPLLYQVASSLLDPSEIARPARGMLRRLSNVDVRIGRVTRLDLDARQVLTDNGALPYDYLVLACGSINNFFGNEELARNAFGLKDLGQALALRNHVLQQFERASWSDDPGERRRLLTFVIVGGGPTGIEYAGALSELVGLVLRKDFPYLDMAEARIVLIEAAPDLLTGFAPRLAKAALKTLRRKRIDVRLGVGAKDYGDGELILSNGQRLQVDTIVWTAGVRAAPIGPGLADLTTRQDRLTVDPTLQLTGHPEVFVVGDLAGIVQEGKPLPMMIPPAQQEGRHVARNIQRLLRNEALLPFRYKDPGMMATIGRNSGVAQVGPFRFSGFIGWVIWLGFHLLKVVSFRNRLVILIAWAVDYLFYDRPVRLIVGPTPPPAEEGSRSTPPSD